MKMTGEHQIPAKISEVWKALNNPDILKDCIPGCTELEAIDSKHLKATIALKIGPVSAKFIGEVELSDIIEPQSYRIYGEGKGGAAGFAKGGANVKLEEIDENNTVLRYEVDAKIGGKLAQLGSRLIDSTSKKLAGKFFDNFVKIFEKTEEKNLYIHKKDNQMKKEKRNLPDGIPEENVYDNTHIMIYVFYAIAVGSVILLLVNQ
jgi:carbon monoxide dehydrogenase subunit G